jgi:hypothetical protein
MFLLPHEGQDIGRPVPNGSSHFLPQPEHSNFLTPAAMA